MIILYHDLLNFYVMCFLGPWDYLVIVGVEIGQLIQGPEACLASGGDKKLPPAQVQGHLGLAPGQSIAHLSVHCSCH